MQCAPAVLTAAALAAVIPPMATTGLPARCTALRRPSMPCGGGRDAPGLLRVAKIGPNLDQLRPPQSLVFNTIINGCVQNLSSGSPQACLGFGTMPAFAADFFGPKNAGTIYGAMLTAWSAGGIVGPILITSFGTAKNPDYDTPLYIIAVNVIG